VLATDIDGDQDIDVVVSVGDDEEMWLYEQSGVNIKADPPTFALKFTEEDIYGINSLFSIDVNGDGINDILTASDTDDTVAWYTAVPQCSDNGALCQVDSDCSTGNTCALAIVKTVVDDDADDAASVYAGDLDGDNTNDVLAANKAQDEIAWYQNDGTSLNFAKYVISDTAAGSSSVVMADVDLDGDIDAASGSNNKDRIQWYEDDCRTFAPTSEPTAVPTGTPLDDTTIRTAVAAWLADATAAEATYGHISTWATGGVTDMSTLFSGAYSFNEDIGAWDTSGVTDMYGMFTYASAFNRDIGSWATAGVTTMDRMFD
jgi:surface protein